MVWAAVSLPPDRDACRREIMNARSNHRQDPQNARDVFRGNKKALPSKPCAVCERPMSWRKRWAKNWDEVKYCSDACRMKRSR